MAEVGPGGIRGNVARIAKRKWELVANRIVPPETERTSKCARSSEPPFLDFLSRNWQQAAREISSGSAPSQVCQPRTVATSAQVLLNAWDALEGIGAP